MSMADAATDEFDRDLALGQLAAKQDALYEIDEAIRRLEHNLYGICEITGKPIPLSRLAAIPWTRFTEEAEEELERQGAVSHPRLGPVASTKRRSPAAFAPAPEDTETQEPKMEDLRMLEYQSTEEPELTATNEEPDL
jgi:RNA polymerase-binding transcription factor DksA